MSGFAPLVGAKQTLDGLRLWDEDRFDVLCAPDNPHMAGMPPRLTSRDELFKKAVVDNRGLRNFRLVRGQSFAAADCRDRHQQASRFSPTKSVVAHPGKCLPFFYVE